MMRVAALCLCLLASVPVVKVLGVSDQNRGGSEARIRVANVRSVTTEARFRAAAWSPTTPGQLAFIGDDGTYLFDNETGRVEKRSQTIAAPFFVWSGDRLVFRTVTEDGVMRMESLSLRTGDTETLVISSDLTLPQPVERGVAFLDGMQLRKSVLGSELAATSPLQEGVFAYQAQDKIYVVISGRAEEITTSPGQYFLPQISPDRTKLLFQELSTGLYVYDLERGSMTALGPGDDPTWAPTSDFVAFEVTTDDGHNVASSDLYVADLAGWRVRLETGQTRAMRPSWSADGDRLAFDADGRVYIADVIREEGR